MESSRLIQTDIEASDGEVLATALYGVARRLAIVTAAVGLLLTCAWAVDGFAPRRQAITAPTREVQELQELDANSLAPHTVAGARSLACSCKGGFCTSLSRYPVRGASRYAEFNVPALPKKIGPTFFVYYNIDWQPAGPTGSDAVFNQFVPQLMLGHPLSDSSGPPEYKPKWHKQNTWVIGAQYYFKIFNKTANKRQAHAVTGDIFGVQEGEIIFIRYTLSKEWVWTIEIGVKGDSSRLSTVIAEKPFMGLLPETKSWSEALYAEAWGNACWEAYNVAEASHYPRSGMTFTWTITADVPGALKWSDWSARSATCPGHPQQNITSVKALDKQVVTWKVYYEEEAGMLTQ